MTKQEKQLLLIDLCARLPYGVTINKKVCHSHRIEELIDIGYGQKSNEVYVNGYPIKQSKPYLRPMSSMTEEEKEHLQTLHNIISDENYGDGFSPAAWEAILDFNNYCREHHLDNGGLITLGLALEAPDGMYK